MTSTTALNARTGPSVSYPVVKTYAPGSTVPAVCQAPGSTVGSTNVWDKLSDGAYVTDYYVNTPSNTGYSAPLHRCGYPYQVTVSAVLYERSGPGRSYPIAGQIPNWGLAWVVCQKAGSTVATTSVWDRLQDSHWVSDYYVATPGNTTYSKPAPRR